MRMRGESLRRFASYLLPKEIGSIRRNTPFINLREFCGDPVPRVEGESIRGLLARAGARFYSIQLCQPLRQTYGHNTLGSSQARSLSSSKPKLLAGASERQSNQRKAAQQGLYLVALVVGMVGVTYASVPLYRMFCQATGYGGTVQQGTTVEEKLRKRVAESDLSLEAAAAARELTVSFNADVTDGMNWRFMPTQRSLRISPGQSTLAFYTAHNLSNKSITGVSTYNVSPQQAGAYFNKIQCFCFEEQKLRPGEKVDMPVFFYIDPEFATDPQMKGINHLTLSYTFFKVSEEEEVVSKTPIGAAEGCQ